MLTLKVFNKLAQAMVQPGLETITRRHVKRHYRMNPVLKQYGYSPARRVANWVKRHRWASCFCGAAIYLAVIAASWAVYPLQTGPRVPVGITDFYRDLQTINFAMLAAQAALVGLVLPIVIALVGLLSGGTISYRGRLNLFVQETEASFVGALSIGLLVVLALQSLLLGQVPVRVGAAITAVNIIWFTLNISGIAFFLFQTLRYIQPDLRFDIEKRYLANVVWRRQLTDLVRDNRWKGAQHYGYWPDPKSANGEEDAPLIVTGAWNFGGEHETAIAPRRNVEVRNIRIHLIGFIIAQWLIRYQGQTDNNRSTVLEFPLSPRQTVEETQVIARIKNGPPLTWLESRLLRAAYVLRNPKRRRDFGTVAAFIEETINDLMRLAEQERASEFRALLEQLTDLQGFLFDIAEAPQADEAFNYADLEDWRGMKLSIRWARPYRDLHRKVVGKIGAEPDLFASMAWWSPHIVSRAKRAAPAAVNDMAMTLSSHLLRRLLDWASDDYMTQTGKESGPQTRFEISPRHKESYTASWIAFVGSWERLLDIWKMDFDPAHADWKSFERSASHFSEHLARTAVHVALSVHTGEDAAMRWSIDMLIKWPSAALSFARNGNGLGDVEPAMITIQIFKQNWDHVSSDVLPRYLRTDQLDGWTPAKNSIWESALENLANDMRFTLAVFLCKWAVSADGDGQSTNAVRRLLRGEVQDHGWRGGRENVSFTFGDMITALLRITFIDSSTFAADHNEAISALFRRMNDIGGRRYVSSRIYSGSGSDRMLDAIEAQVIALCASVPLNIATPRIGRDDQLLFDHAVDDSARRQMIDHLTTLRAVLDGENAPGLDHTIAAIRADAAPAAPQARASLRAILSAYIDRFESARNEAFAAAPISNARMREIAEAASSLGFSSETGEFPISIIGSVELVDETLQLFTLRAMDQNAGEFTDPQFGTPVSNEREYLSKVMRQQAAAVVMADAVRQFTPQEITTRTAEAFWQEIERLERTIRGNELSPAVIIPAHTEPRWMAEWRWPDRYPEVWRPSDLRIQIKEGMPRGYLFHLNDLPVFVGAIRSGAAYILPLETFERVRFSSFETIPVAARFERYDENPWKGDLLLEFARDVTVGRNHIYMLSFSDGD